MMKILVGLVAFAVVMLIAWYGGLEIMERGFMQAFFLGAAIFVGISACCAYADYEELSK